MKKHSIRHKRSPKRTKQSLSYRIVIFTALSLIVISVAIVLNTLFNIKDALGVGPSVAIKASEDTYVDQEEPANIYGQLQRMYIDGSPLRYAYFKFDLSDPSFAGKTVTAAKLRVRAAKETSKPQYMYFVPSSDWSEQTMTFNNRAAINGKLIGQGKGGTLDAWVEMPLSSLIEVQSKLGGMFSLALANQSTSRFDMYTHETTSKPELVLEFDGSAPGVPTVAPQPTITSVPPTAVPTRAPTTAPGAPTPTRIPPTPTPSPIFNPPTTSSSWGVYPNCVAPAVPLEVHSWWHQNGEALPRHVHLASCVPNAHANNGGGVTFSGKHVFTNRIMTFNSPGVVNGVRWSWESDVKEKKKLNLQCQRTPDERKECTWYVDLTLDSDLANGSGLHELRLSPNVEHGDLKTRQFATLNYEVFVDKGGTYKNYRSTAAPIGRAWYDHGFDYANAELNYQDFFKSSNETIPTVGGIVPLKVKHSQGTGTVNSFMFQDPNFHLHPESHERPADFAETGMKMLYKKPGEFSGTYNWDTRGLSNGVHSIYIQTEESTSEGLNAGAIKFFFNVQN